MNIVEDKIKLSELNRLTKRLNRDLKGADIDISFDFFMATLFPKIYDNIKNAMTQQYIAGYNEGKREV